MTSSAMIKCSLNIRLGSIYAFVRSYNSNSSVTFYNFLTIRGLRSVGGHTKSEITIINDVKKLQIPFVKKDVSEDVVNKDTITSTEVSLLKKKELDVLEPCNEDVSDISPFFSPSFNLAAYVNNSPTLQQFVQMGVELHNVEKKKGAAACVLNLDFEKHVKPCLRFLHDNGLPADEFGRFITKNPFIFDQNLEDLQVRINYLEAKKFSKDGISRIITKSPWWLNFSTIEIDKRLGFFQRNFILSGDEVRTLAVKRPQLITYRLEKVTFSLFSVKEEMGFDEHDAKALLLAQPKVYSIQTKSLKARFDYVHNVMGISHEQILRSSSILVFREFIIKQRHEFLKELGKAQYDPKLPGYVSLETLVTGTDVDFCKNVAKTSVDVFNSFLKSC